MTTPLTHRIAAQIVQHIRDEGLTSGTRLVERTMAARLHVSRSPIRNALLLLADDGVVRQSDGGGFHVARTGDDLPAPADPNDGTDDGTDDGAEATHFRIATDRLNGDLPDRVTEIALARRYGLTAGQVRRVLARIDKEGWIGRAPGYGWEFRPMLTSLRGYQDSYRFRLAIEPAAIMEPGFVLDRPAIEAGRARQLRLLDGEIWTVSKATLFDVNSRFHQAVIACSNNEFFVESLARLVAVRRLADYRATLRRDRAIIRCREHVALADLLLAGDRAGAAELLHRHLETVDAEPARP